jgi:hypothetical protein
MELNIDLLAKDRIKSRMSVIAGIIFLILATMRIIPNVFADSEVVKPLDWFLLVAWILLSTVYILQGLGYSIEKFFGWKAYILIDSELISVKTSAYKKGVSINWNEIKSFHYSRYGRLFTIKKTDGKIMDLSFHDLDFATLQEVKKTINHIANEKNIQNL